MPSLNCGDANGIITVVNPEIIGSQILLYRAMAIHCIASPNDSIAATWNRFELRDRDRLHVRCPRMMDCVAHARYILEQWKVTPRTEPAHLNADIGQELLICRRGCRICHELIAYGSNLFSNGAGRLGKSAYSSKICF